MERLHQDGGNGKLGLYRLESESILFHYSARPGYEDRLVSIWHTAQGKPVRRGKRVPHDCPISKSVRRVYVKEGIVKAVILLKSERPELSLREAVNLVNLARGKPSYLPNRNLLWPRN